MEIQVTDLLSIIKRLDQVQDQQSQTQNLLHEKLSEMTVRLEQEKIFMRDQLREAQNEILRRLRDIQGQGEDAVNVIPTSVSDTDHVLHQMSQSTVDLSDVINEARDKLQILDDRTNLMKTQITDTEQTYYNLTRWSGKIETLLENKITELVDHEKENLKTISDMVRGQTRAELEWLDNRIDERLTDLDTTVNLKIEQLIRETCELTEQSGEFMDILIKQQEQINSTLVKQQGDMLEKLFKLQEKLSDVLDKQNQAVLDLQTKTEHVYRSVSDNEKQNNTSVEKILGETKNSVMKLEKYFNNRSTDITRFYKTIRVLEEQLTSVPDTLKTEIRTCTHTLKTELETCTEKITKTTDTTKEDLLKHLTNSEAVQSESLSKYTGEIKTLITSLTENVDTVKENMTVAVKKIENMKTSLNDGHKNINNKFDVLTQGQEEVRIKIKEARNDVTEYICKTKREIFAITEKEAQIVRDRIEGPLPSHGKYTFDFYVENFKDLVRSEKEVYSPPWHINEMTSCVIGTATFDKNGEIEVMLMNGRHPHEVGLQPRPGKRLKVKASICDIGNKTLPTLDFGRVIMDIDESDFPGNGDWGCGVGVMSCDDLIEKGYGLMEDYWFDAVLIRFDITVV